MRERKTTLHLTKTFLLFFVLLPNSSASSCLDFSIFIKKTMDTNNWRPSQVGEASMDAGDWRSQLPQESRQRIVNKIMDTLKRHLPFSGQEGLQELKKIAVRFEDKIYVAATSQSEYLRKISLKMLTMETKSQSTMANSLQSNSAGNSNSPSDPGSFDMQSQVPSQGQSLSTLTLGPSSNGQHPQSPPPT